MIQSRQLTNRYKLMFTIALLILALAFANILLLRA